MEKITEKDVSCTRIHYGWLLATVVNGHRVHCTYGGYTKREAIRDFLKGIREGKHNA